MSSRAGLAADQSGHYRGAGLFRRLCRPRLAQPDQTIVNELTGRSTRPSVKEHNDIPGTILTVVTSRLALGAAPIIKPVATQASSAGWSSRDGQPLPQLG